MEQEWGQPAWLLFATMALACALCALLVALAAVGSKAFHLPRYLAAEDTRGSHVAMPVEELVARSTGMYDVSLLEARLTAEERFLRWDFDMSFTDVSAGLAAASKAVSDHQANSSMWSILPVPALSNETVTA